ncbi:MAG: hypothetical protein AABX99_02760 [Nanoarchaeota archaeon]
MISLKELNRMVHQEMHKTKEEWEKEISWRMFKSGYGNLNDKLIESDYYFWKRRNEKDYENGGEEEIGDNDSESPNLLYVDYFSKKEIEKHDNDLQEDFYQNELSLEEELNSQLMEMLRIRHHLPRNKRILF